MCKQPILMAAWVLAFVAAPNALVWAATDDDDHLLNFADVLQTLRDSCADCHSADAVEGGFSLAEVEAESSLRDQFLRWSKIRTRVNDRSMPPADATPLADDEREALTTWIADASIEAICRDGPVAGPPLLRRLARYEYSNTIRDLLNIHFDAGQVLPEDAAGGEGFSNASETLVISPIHAEKYLQAAIDALDYAARDSRARRRLLSARPSDERSEDAAARENLHDLARRAFRRPLVDDEVDRYATHFRQARDDELPFDEAVLYAMRGILISPSFLFLGESAPAHSDVPELLTDHEIAARLSYFLWASTPDNELSRVADEGCLNDPEELRKQALRMIASRGTHFQDSMEEFVGSWLGTADLGRSKHVDRQRHRWISDPHVAALRNQPVYAMVSIIKENESILSLIDAPWTFLNDELTRVYRIKKSNIKEEFVQNLVRVNLPEEYAFRGGLLGMGGVMAVSSYPRRTSPVLRGAWVLEKMLGVELPSPPPNVPSLEESEQAAQASTLRERLERHRGDSACATCHNRIDPIGFALENLDELGRWRDQDEGGSIDAVARLPGDVEIDGLAGLKQHILEQKDAFARVLTRKMLGYALGRGLRPSDLCAVELIVRQLRDNEYRSHELILGIVTSETFRKKMLTASQMQ